MQSKQVDSEWLCKPTPHPNHTHRLIIFSYFLTYRLLHLLINDWFLRLYAIKINFSCQINTHLPSFSRTMMYRWCNPLICIIILVPIPSLPKPLFLTVLISCKHSCRFSPLQNTGYPMRKLTIHFGNRPPIKRQGKLTLTQHNITPPLHKTQLSQQITFTEAWYAPHIHKSFHSHIFTSLKMSIPITILLH